MNSTDKSLDEQIREEQARIEREVIMWIDQPQSAQPTIHWKPRTNSAAFERQGRKRLVPLDHQIYSDLQLSRGIGHPSAPLSPDWDRSNPDEDMALHAALNEERLRHFTRFITLDADSRLLELGMRSGHFLAYLISQGYRHVTGVDIVKLNVLWCQKHGLNVFEADVHELSAHLPSGSVDAIFAYHVLEHCYDPERALHECSQVLTPEGALHVEIPIGGLDLNRGHCYSFHRGEMRKMLRSAGFSVLDSHAVAPIERLVARKRPAQSQRLGGLRAILSRWRTRSS